MLTDLRVRNLKSIADSGEVRLRPLTFLMGPNSSGKSTLLQAILVAKQTVDSRDLTNPLAIDGDLVQLGSYREFVHRHERRRRLQLTYGFTSDSLASSALERYRVRSLTLSAEFSYNQKTLQIFPTEVSYFTQPQQYEYTKRRLSAKRSVAEFGTAREPEFSTTVPAAAKFYDFTNLSLRPGRSREADLASRLPFYLTRAFEAQLGSTFYVGPLRTGPQRTYVASGETPQDVGLRGESTPAILWAARWNRRLGDTVLGPLGDWLSKFAISAKLEVKRIGGTYFALLFSDPHLKVAANFADVGFGASQLLPTVVEVLYAPLGSTVILEQPEIHLHPAAQAILGDFFVDQAKRGQQLIAETHSEHLVSRVLTRIAEGQFSPDQLAIHYCERTEEGTKFSEIAIDEFGRLGEGLPKGFFDQGYVESFSRVEAAAKRIRDSD